MTSFIYSSNSQNQMILSKLNKDMKLFQIIPQTIIFVLNINLQLLSNFIIINKKLQLFLKNKILD